MKKKKEESKDIQQKINRLEEINLELKSLDKDSDEYRNLLKEGLEISKKIVPFIID